MFPVKIYFYIINWQCEREKIKIINQEKIGKFILECRKKKNLTQQELVEKLGVSDRSVGNWENGRNMPDLSLFKPLCKELDITLNDLMSAKR